MLEKPDLQDEKIMTHLQEVYGLPIAQLTFLPLGADSNTAVYRAITANNTPYFAKLRRGPFAKISLTLPKFLNDQGLTHIIPPLPTKTGQLWATLQPFTLILYPFIEGDNGWL